MTFCAIWLIVCPAHRRHPKSTLQFFLVPSKKQQIIYYAAFREAINTHLFTRFHQDHLIDNISTIKYHLNRQFRQNENYLLTLMLFLNTHPYAHNRCLIKTYMQLHLYLFSVIIFVITLLAVPYNLTHP